MIIYNVTIKVDWTIAEDWLQWMQTVHIPEIMATGLVEKHLLVRLLQVDETDGPTYAAQYFFTSLAKYNDYLQHYSASLSKQISQKWGDKYIDFKTLMQQVG